MRAFRGLVGPGDVAFVEARDGGAGGRDFPGGERLCAAEGGECEPRSQDNREQRAACLARVRAAD